MHFRITRWAVPDNEVALLAAAMPPPPTPKPVVPLEDLEPAMVRARGQNLQDNLRLAMRRLLVKITWQVTMPGPDLEAENATFLYDCVTACMPISLPMCQPACLLLCLCISLHVHFYAYVSAYMHISMPVCQPACPFLCLCVILHAHFHACVSACLPSCIPVPNFFQFRAFYSEC
jgi:hypothetical protein